LDLSLHYKFDLQQEINMIILCIVTETDR